MIFVILLILAPGADGIECFTDFSSYHVEGTHTLLSTSCSKESVLRFENSCHALFLQCACMLRTLVIQGFLHPYDEGREGHMAFIYIFGSVYFGLRRIKREA